MKKQISTTELEVYALKKRIADNQADSNGKMALDNLLISAISGLCKHTTI